MCVLGGDEGYFDLTKKPVDLQVKGCLLTCVLQRPCTDLTSVHIVTCESESLYRDLGVKVCESISDLRIKKTLYEDLRVKESAQLLGSQRVCVSRMTCETKGLYIDVHFKESKQ